MMSQASAPTKGAVPRKIDVSRLLVSVAALVPLSTLLGWTIDSPWLEGSGASSGTRMNPFVALSLLCVAVCWFLLYRLGQPTAARYLALIPLALGSFRLIEYLQGIDSGIDFLLFHQRILSQPHPNRMAPNSLLMVVGLSLPFLLVDKGGLRDTLRAWITILAATLPFFAILGYASNLSSLFSLKFRTPMALNTAVAGLLLAIACLVRLKRTAPLRPFASGTSGGLMARRLLPLALGLPILAGFLLSTAVNLTWMDRATAFTTFIVLVVLVFVIVIHTTAARLDEFDDGRMRQQEIIQNQNRELTTAHASLNAVLDAATQTGIIGMDAKGTVRIFNTGAEALLGYRAAEVVGSKTFNAFCENHALPGPDSVPVRGVFHTLIEPLKANAYSDCDLPLIRQDGTCFTAGVTMTAQQDPHREGGGYLALIRDITELRRNEEALREAKLAAESATRSKSEFLATMSHEIRTPMNGVIGMTALLLDTPLSPEQQEYVETIRDSGESLLAIINDILDFSKIEAGKLELEDVDFDLYSTIAECAAVVAETAYRKGLALLLPRGPAKPLVVRADQGRLRQVLLNLLSNAIKFTPAGEVALEVETTAAAAGSHRIRVEVRDTGIGISPAITPQLFRAFTQADSSTTRRFGGTGLGLVICKRLVELMGGEIGVVSQEGHGSTFWFHVTAGPAQAALREAPIALCGRE